MKNLLIVITLFLFTSHSYAGKYFAEVDKSNVVKRVIVADSVEWCTQVGGTWIETFMDNPDRNYAGRGYDYYEIYRDFVTPTPFVSWVLDEKRKWKAPIDMPQDGKMYKWDETVLNWKLSQ